MRKLVSGALIFFAACAPASTREIHIDTALDSLLRQDTATRSVAYAAAPKVLDGGVLMLAVSEADRCAEVETPRKHRVTHVERHTSPKVMAGFWVIGVLAALTGVVSYTEPERVAASQNQMNAMAMAITPAEVRQAGIAELAIGGLAAALAVGSYMRARDSDRDDGVISGSPVRREHPCNERMSRNTRVVLELYNGVTRNGTTDDQGVVAFSLADVPGTALPQRNRPFSASIGAARASLHLADSEVEALWAALAADPQSRLAQDRRAAPRQTNDLLQAVCRSHDRGYELLYGAFTCLAPYVPDICSNRAAATIRYVVHRAIKALLDRTGYRPQGVGGALTLAMAELVVNQLIDRLLDQLIVPAAARYMGEACERWVQQGQPLRPPSDDIFQCGVVVMLPQWIQAQCQPVGP